MKLLPPPGPERRRQLSLLGIVLLGLVIVAWYQWPQAAPAVPTSNPPSGRPQAPQASRLPEPVRLADLAAVPPATDIRRNPFTFGMRERLAEPVSQPALVTNPIFEQPAAPEGPPPISLRLTGLMVGPGTDRMMATLKDPASGALFHAFEGDVVDGRYRLVRVGTQSVVVSYVDGSGIRTLGLGN
jgi:hypothetical protein